MGSLIEDYEQQYSQITAEATSLIGRLGSATSTSEKRKLNEDIESQLEEANTILEQIGLEIRDCDPSQRPGLTSKLNCYNAELKRLKQEFVKAKATQSGANGGHLDNNDDDLYNFGEDQRQRLLDNSERLERTGNHLSNAYRIAVETEEIGAGVLRDLENQRETLTRARSRVKPFISIKTYILTNFFFQLRETDVELGRSSRLLNTMIMRHMRDKFALYLIGIVFAVVVCVSIYFSISKNEPKTH